MVTHNHPEGIKGAQAIAGCVFLKKNSKWDASETIEQFVTQKIGYDLNFELEEIRNDYRFDVTCQGSVPIAIKAYLERSMYPEKALWLAISMGGDSDTIGAMTASIAGAERFNKCQNLLTAKHRKHTSKKSLSKTSPAVQDTTLKPEKDHTV